MMPEEALPDNFFGLLRHWHTKRAFEPLWKKLNLVLAYSTDQRQAIRDPNQSPFNVGIKIELRDFSFDEVWKLNRRYGRPRQRFQDALYHDGGSGSEQTAIEGSAAFRADVCCGNGYTRPVRNAVRRLMHGDFC
ncbi:MAG: AAA-like domain-containing protein [Nitrospinae bacterium]|nr:AAA-like domain-containing protein [Nitrospinota bacterium]